MKKDPKRQISTDGAQHEYITEYGYVMYTFITDIYHMYIIGFIGYICHQKQGTALPDVDF